MIRIPTPRSLALADAADRIQSIAIQHGLGDDVVPVRDGAGFRVELDLTRLEAFARSLAGHGYPTPLELGDTEATLTLDLDGVPATFWAPVPEVTR